MFCCPDWTQDLVWGMIQCQQHAQMLNLGSTRHLTPCFKMQNQWAYFHTPKHNLKLFYVSFNTCQSSTWAAGSPSLPLRLRICACPIPKNKETSGASMNFVLYHMAEYGEGCTATQVLSPTSRSLRDCLPVAAFDGDPFALKCCLKARVENRR